MTKEELKALVATKLAAQGNQVDLGNVLPTIINELVDMIPSATPVIDNLESESSTDALSAKQGKVLAEMIPEPKETLVIIGEITEEDTLETLAQKGLTQEAFKKIFAGNIINIKTPLNYYFPTYINPPSEDEPDYWEFQFSNVISLPDSGDAKFAHTWNSIDIRMNAGFLSIKIGTND